ncbi:AsnC family transcriptional regulator, partial [Sphingosinicella sp.]
MHKNRQIPFQEAKFMRLDDFDRKILRVLQEDCSLSTAEIAE